jgi:hypothetical protein
MSTVTTEQSVKELTLDYSKWRCGYTMPNICNNQLGEGPVRLLNDKGFSCCLGQFCSQLGISDRMLLGESSPSNVNAHVALFNRPAATSGYYDTTLSEDCIIINDDPETTPEQKIAQLTERLAKEGIRLKVINHP